MRPDFNNLAKIKNFRAFVLVTSVILHYFAGFPKIKLSLLLPILQKEVSQTAKATKAPDTNFTCI